jgi:hypothetical protein
MYVLLCNVCMYVLVCVCWCVCVCIYIYMYALICNACIYVCICMFVCERSWYSDKTTTWTILFSVVDRGKKSLSCVGTFSPALRPTKPHIESIPDFFPRRQSGRSAMLTSQLHLVPRLKMSEALLILSLDAFMESSPLRKKKKRNLPNFWWN